MPATYEPIATTTLSTTATQINFTSISSAYTDLRLVFFGNQTAGLQYSVLFNADTTSNYSKTAIYGNGTNAVTYRFSNQTQLELDSVTLATSGVPVLHTLDLFSYAGSTNKTVLVTLSNDKNGTGVTERSVGLYRSTSAISSIRIFVSTSSMAAGTTATLYGILKA